MFQARARATAAGLLLSVGAATAASAAATTIDFDNLQAGDYTGSLTTQGYVLDPGALGTVPGGWSGHYHIASPLDTSWASSNGSNFFVFDYFLDNSVLNIYSDQNSTFSLRSLDLGVALPGIPDCSVLRTPYSMLFSGWLADGSSVSFRQALNMQCDGAGPLSDFQTLTFASEWEQLTRLTIAQTAGGDGAQSYVALDRLVLAPAPAIASPVPEPETYAMWSAGLLALLVARRRSLSRQA